MKTCTQCGKHIEETTWQNKRAKFCNAECYAKHHAKKRYSRQCLHCKKQFAVLGQVRKAFCSKECRYNAARKEGAKYKGTNGYIYIKQKSVWVLEHRKIIEEKIGRKLKTAESVHHKDGDKTNNNAENLEIINNSDHVVLHHAEYKKRNQNHPVNSPEAIKKRVETRRSNRLLQEKMLLAK